MPQLLLPIFPDAVTPIKELLSVGVLSGEKPRKSGGEKRASAWL